MARSPLSLFLLRRLSSSLSLRCVKQSSPYRSGHYQGPAQAIIYRPFSAVSSSTGPDPPKPSNLSARLSFVFDQIDAIERERSQKDQTLQRIRAWRESKHAQIPKSQNAEESSAVDGETQNEARPSPVDFQGVKKEVELVHPWPEWIELMERLVQQNYFDHMRRDEGKMISALGFDDGEDVGAVEILDLTKDLKTVNTAGLNFGKDRFDILRSLSRKDIQFLVGYGCPSADKKVVFSAKLLRKHVRLDEGDVCSSCSLRNSCERAYLVTNKEDEARTIDIMRVLMAFGFDHMHGTVTNESVLKQKSVKAVVRKLLHEVVNLSAVPIDPNLPPPIIKRPPPKVKQPPPPPKKRVGRDDVEMKKGDWLCPKCDFMNFAKNTVCLQCDAKRPKRQLLPGEWECPECNFLNYRRNVVCFHCECKRPPDQFMEDRLQDAQQNSGTTRFERPARKTEVSNAWNFDFDDDESDGADVAPFEHADSTIGKDSPLGRSIEDAEVDFHRGSRFSKVHDGEFSDSERRQPRIGFDDFDEEDDDDDVDSYELDSARSNVPARDFSELERDSDLEDGGLDSDDLPHHSKTQTSFPSRKVSKSKRAKMGFSGSVNGESDFGSDDDLSVPPNWRSSHVADSGARSGGRGSQSGRRLSYGSDDELGVNSDDDDDFTERLGSRKKKSSNFSDRRRFSGSDESDDDDFGSGRSRLKGSRGGGGDNRRGINFKGNEFRNINSSSKGAVGNRKRRYEEDDEFSTGPSLGLRGGSSGSRGGGRGSAGFRGSGRGSAGFRGGGRGSAGFRGGGRGGGSGGFKFNQVSDNRGRDGSSRSFKGRRDEEFGARQRSGRFGKYDEGRGGGDDDFSNRRRVIER